MDRLFTRLVTLFAAACLLINLSACQMLADDLPKDIMLDDNFSEVQEETFLKAVDNWNRVGREYLGYDIIIYQGRYADEEDFFPLEDMNDGNNVIYNVEERDEWYDYLYSVYIQGKYQDAAVAGFGVEEDVLLFDFVIAGVVEDTMEEDDPVEEFQAKYLHYLQYVMVHELGHWVGIQHINSMNSDGIQPVMYPEGNADTINGFAASFLTKKDIQAFCLVYDCIKQP